MKIAIGMKDEKKINEDHFGQSKFYNIYEYDGSNLELKEKRDNPYFGDGKHAKVGEIKEVVGDCKIWVAVAMGKQSRLNLIESGYKPILSKSNNLDDVLNEIKKYFLEMN